MRKNYPPQTEPLCSDRLPCGMGPRPFALPRPHRHQGAPNVPRGLLSLALAVVLALAFLMGGCSGSDSGGSGANPATSLAIVTYQGLPVQKRWVDTCEETGLNTDSSCVTDLYAAGVTSGNGEATLSPLPPAPSLCMTTNYTIPVKYCQSPALDPISTGQRCQTICQTTGVPCQLDIDCPIGDVCSDEGTPNPCSLFCSQSGSACSVDSDCPGNQTCTGGCINMPKGNALEGSVGVCRSTLVGACDFSNECTTGLCEKGLCAISGTCAGSSEGCDLRDETSCPGRCEKEPSPDPPPNLLCRTDDECKDKTGYTGTCDLSAGPNGRLICTPDSCFDDGNCTVVAGDICEDVVCPSTGSCPDSSPCLPLPCTTPDDCLVPTDLCERSPCLTVEDCSVPNDSCLLPAQYVKVCESNGQPCQTQLDCPSSEESCAVPGSVCSGDSSLSCSDTEPCPDPLGPCVAPLPGTPCYSIAKDCPKYCSLNPLQTCSTVTDCGNFCSITEVQCASNADCTPGKLCLNTGEACLRPSDCDANVRRCEFSGAACLENDDCEESERCLRNNCRADRCGQPAGLSCDSRTTESCDAPREETAYCGFPLPDTVRLSN